MHAAVAAAATGSIPVHAPRAAASCTGGLNIHIPNIKPLIMTYEKALGTCSHATFTHNTQQEREAAGKPCRP